MGILQAVEGIGDGLLNWRASGCNKVVNTTATIVARRAGEILSGVAAVGNLMNKNYGDAARIGKNIAVYEGRKVKCLGQATMNTARTMAAGGWEAIKTGSISPSTKSKLMAGAAIVGTAVVSSEIASELVDAPLDVAGAADGLFPIGELPGVRNGIFVGTDANLNQLVSIGEIDGAHHVDAVRDPAMVHQFLQMHGIIEQPPGYEVHHIIPLSEGGADAPDNMVLIREDQHDYITAKHRAYYGW